MLLRGLIAVALVLLLLPAPPARGASGDGGESETTEASVRLPVEARETGDDVRLRIRLPAEVKPDSVELQLAGREVVVRARGVQGEELRSGVILLAWAP